MGVGINPYETVLQINADNLALQCEPNCVNTATVLGTNIVTKWKADTMVVKSAVQMYVGITQVVKHSLRSTRIHG